MQWRIHEGAIEEMSPYGLKKYFQYLYYSLLKKNSEFFLRYNTIDW